MPRTWRKLYGECAENGPYGKSGGVPDPGKAAGEEGRPTDATAPGRAPWRGAYSAGMTSMSEGAVLHLKGRVLVGPDDVRDELWVVDGRVTFDRPVMARDATTVTGWALPGLVDAHCHVGLDAHGPVDAPTSEKQALTDRDAGTLLIRDAGSPSDTRWVDDREDLPRIIRAGRHIARTKRYIRNYAHEIEPEDLVAYVAQEARRGDGWVKLVGDWIDRSTGDLAACWPAGRWRRPSPRRTGWAPG